MKATGVVRRIDELGRIVIPKEIRRTLKIREGTPLEIYSGDSGELLLKKYSPITELAEIASDICKSIAVGTQKSVLISNMEKIIATSGTGSANFLDKNIDSVIEKLINARQSKIVNQQQTKSMLFFDTNIYTYGFCPIINSGDVYGGIFLFDTKGNIAETDLNTIKAFADFLATQIGWLWNKTNFWLAHLFCLCQVYLQNFWGHFTKFHLQKYWGQKGWEYIKWYFQFLPFLLCSHQVELLLRQAKALQK